jgi:hypothetical protein
MKQNPLWITCVHLRFLVGFDSLFQVRLYRDNIPSLNNSEFGNCIDRTYSNLK